MPVEPPVAALFDQLPDIVFFVKDAEGRYTDANRTLAERCGLRDKSELLGKRPAEVLGGGGTES